MTCKISLWSTRNLTMIKFYHYSSLWLLSFCFYFLFCLFCAAQTYHLARDTAQTYPAITWPTIHPSCRPYFRPHGQYWPAPCRRTPCGPQKIWHPADDHCADLIFVTSCRPYLSLHGRYEKHKTHLDSRQRRPGDVLRRSEQFATSWWCRKSTNLSTLTMYRLSKDILS